MPIPLYNGGQAITTKGPGLPVLDQQQRPRVNFGGVIEGINETVKAAGDLAGASAPVLINPHAFDGKTQGMEALGRGVEVIGEAIGQQVERSLQAKNYADIAEGKRAMNAEFDDFNAWRMQPENMNNTQAWGPEWKRRMDRLQKTIGGNKTYSPFTQQKLGIELADFAQRTNGNVIDSAISRQLSRADEATRFTYARQIEQGDYEGAKQTRANRVNVGLETPEQSAYHLSHDVDNGERANDIAAAPDVVKGWIQEPEKYDGIPERWKNLSATQKLEYYAQAERTHLEQKALYISALKQAVARGDVKNMHEFMAWHKTREDGIMDMGDRDTIRAIVGGAYPDMGQISALMDKAKNFDPKLPNPELRAAQLQLEFSKANAPEQYEKALNGALAEVIRAGKSGPTALAFGRETLQKMHDEERLTDDAGNPLIYRQEKFLTDALTDKEKLRAFGLQGAVKELQSIEGEGRIERFRELLKQRTKGNAPEINDVDAYNKLTPFTRDLFNKALHEGTFVDPAVRDKSAAIADRLKEELELWQAKHPEANADDVLKWIHDNTTKDRRVKAGSILTVPDRAPKDPPGLTLPSWQRLGNSLGN